MKKILYSIAILSGTIIGVGLFGLPYVISKVGIWIGLTYFVVLGLVTFLIHYLFAELALHTPDFKRIPGFAKIYLGEKGRNFTLVISVLSLLGALLAYIVLGGGFLHNLLSPYLGGSMFFYSFIYFIVASLIIFLGIKTTANISFWGLLLFVLILLLGFFRGLPEWELTNFLVSSKTNFSHLFLPYGVVLFSLWGLSLIPEVEEFLGKDKKLIKKIILPAILIPVFISFLFVFLTLGLTGENTTQFAIDGFRGVLNNGIVSIMLFLGFLTTFTSFIVLGLTLKKIFWFDLKIPRIWAWFLACFPPFFLYMAGMQDFIRILSFVGAVMLATEAIIVLLMYRKLGKLKPEQISNFKRFLIYPLILFLGLGIFYEIYYFIINL